MKCTFIYFFVIFPCQVSQTSVPKEVAYIATYRSTICLTRKLSLNWSILPRTLSHSSPWPRSCTQAHSTLLPATTSSSCSRRRDCCCATTHRSVNSVRCESYSRSWGHNIFFRALVSSLPELLIAWFSGNIAFSLNASWFQNIVSTELLPWLLLMQVLNI